MEVEITQDDTEQGEPEVKMEIVNIHYIYIHEWLTCCTIGKMRNEGKLTQHCQRS